MKKIACIPLIFLLLVQSSIKAQESLIGFQYQQKNYIFSMKNTLLKNVNLPNEVRLDFVEQGKASGVPVILLHGVTDSWHSYDLVLPYLPDAVHVFALSQRGHGNSDRPASSYSPRDFAEDLAAFMDVAGLKRAIIAGHSMGTTVAQRFAIDYPERTLGLVLIGSFISWRSNPGLVEFSESVISKLTDPLDPGFVREFQESTLAQQVPPAFMDTIVQESLKVPARVWRGVFESFIEDDFSTEMGKIKVPAMLIWGDRDSFCIRNDQEMLSAALSNARVVIYPGSGHGAHWDEPKRFATDLIDFVKAL
jgi:pimeloyl-ACP methyl ester carboxylesterase